MTFDELNELINKKFGTSKLSDIARELDVTPQVVSNWKSRNQVPYKYIKLLRKKISKMDVKNQSINIENVFKRNIKDYSQSEEQFQDFDFYQLVQQFLSLYRKILKKKFIVIASCILFLGLFIFIYSRATPEYVTKFTILPISNGASGNSIAGLASQVGISAGEEGSSGLFSSNLFPDIIRSRKLAKNLLMHEYSIKKYDAPQKLINIILKKPDKDTSSFTVSQKQIAISRLLKLYSSRKLKKRSPLFTISVNTFDPEFSLMLSKSVISEVKNLVRNFKLSSTLKKKQFIENRLEEIFSDLKLVEDRLKNFREKNRQILESPALLLEHERLLRDVEVQNQVYITMRQQHEMVKVDFFDNTNMLEVLDEPELPLFDSRLKLSIYIFAAIILSLTFSSASILLVDWYSSLKGEN